MACKNCGTPESAVSAKTGSVNNTGYSDNFFMCECPEKPGRPMDRPAIQFISYKNTANDLDTAVEIIKKKHPPLRPGEPAIVPYEVHAVNEDGTELKDIDHIDILLAVGGMNGAEPMIIPSLCEIDSRIKKSEESISDTIISEIQTNEIIQETITNIVKNTVGDNVVTKDQLDSAVDDAIKKADLASKDDIKDLAKTADVDKKIEEKTAGFVKADDLSGLATKDELAGLATKDDVKNLVSADEVEKIIDGKDFVTRAESDKAIADAVASIDIPEVPTDDHIKDLAKEVHDANMPEIPSDENIRTIAREEATAAAPSDDKIKEIVNTEIKSETTKETITSIVSETVTADPLIEEKITEVVKKIDSSMSWKDDSGDDGWDSEIDGE